MVVWGEHLTGYARRWFSYPHICLVHTSTRELGGNAWAPRPLGPGTHWGQKTKNKKKPYWGSESQAILFSLHDSWTSKLHGCRKGTWVPIHQGCCRKIKAHWVKTRTKQNKNKNKKHLTLPPLCLCPSLVCVTSQVHLLSWLSSIFHLQGLFCPWPPSSHLVLSLHHTYSIRDPTCSKSQEHLKITKSRLPDDTWGYMPSRM